MATFDPSRARELYDDGHSCNSIARELGVAPSTVSKWAKREGLAFDRSQTAMAVRAHTIDLASARIELAQKMMVAASDALDSLDRPYLVFAFGGKDNDYNEHELDEPPIEARTKVMQVARDAFNAATRVVEKDNGGLDDAVGVIDNLARNLHAAAELLRSEDADVDARDGD